MCVVLARRTEVRGAGGFKKLSIGTDDMVVQATEISVAPTVDVITSIEQASASASRLFDRAVAHGVTGETAADLRLAAIELATNAFEHGATTAVSFGFFVDDHSVVVRSEHVDAGIAPDPNDAVMPPPMSVRGRGLAIIRALASTVHRTVVDGVTVTVITLDRADAVGDRHSVVAD